MKGTLLHKAFIEAEHPRDEAGRFEEKGNGRTLIKTAVVSSGEVKQSLETVKNNDIVNTSTGIVARISSTGINKMISNRAVQKSEANGFTRREHYGAACQIKNLFEQATLIAIHDDQKDTRSTILAIKRFSSPIRTESGKNGEALITVKETEEHGHRIYSIELDEIIKPLERWGAKTDKPQRWETAENSGTPTPTAYTSSITKAQKNTSYKVVVKNKTPVWIKPSGVQGSETERAHANQSQAGFPLRGLAGNSDASSIPNKNEKSSLSKSSARTAPIASSRLSPVYKALRRRLAQMQGADNQQQRNREDTMSKAIKRGLNTITVQDVLGRMPYTNTKGAQPELFSEREPVDAVNVTPCAVQPPTLLTKAARGTLPKEENIDITALLKKQTAMMQQEHITRKDIQAYGANTMSRQKGLRSLFYDPLLLDTHRFGPVHTVSPYYGRMITYRILRRVSEKAWILNLCISNLIKKVRPFLKPSTEENTRGFRITAQAAKERSSGMTAAEKKQAKALEDFFLYTGDIADPLREDDLDKYVSKIIRDVCQLDQIAAELQRKQNGELCAFWAVDPATIEIALPLSEQATGIKYVQVINNIPYAYYPREGMLFDCMNPRTDIERAGYGYSVVEQAIDLITSSINTFMFNAGFFIENKLPRGILLLNGDADTTEVEAIEEYIVNIMSGAPSSQWRIPIIPAGKTGGSGSRQLEWINLQGSNKEMEFQAWFDLQLSGIVGLFGFSMEDLGLHSQKSAPLIGGNTSPKIETSKSLVLGDILSFLQKHFNRILSYKNPDYTFEFVGYEKNDVKLILDLDKGEIESYKTIDEKRKEKGLPPFNEKWSKVPLNAQAVQMYQSEQTGEGGSGMIDEEGGYVPPDFDDENGTAAGEPDTKADSMDGTAADEAVQNKKPNGKKTGWDTLSKSLSNAVKLTI